MGSLAEKAELETDPRSRPAFTQLFLSGDEKVTWHVETFAGFPRLCYVKSVPSRSDDPGRGKRSFIP
jgi:hypothetical protein